MDTLVSANAPKVELEAFSLAPPSADAERKISSQLVTAFQRFFAIKLLGTYLVLGAKPSSVAVNVFLALATCAMCWAPLSRYGVWAFCAISWGNVIQSWPYTLNHFILESLILTVLAFFPLRLDGEANRQRAEAVELIWLALLSVWVYAAIQKLVHGHYINGEYMALTLLTAPGGLGDYMRAGLALVQRVLGSEPSNVIPLDLGQVPLSAGKMLNGVERAFCLAHSWATLLIELLLPALAVCRPTQRLAFVGLTLGQLAIALTSGELDFGLTAIGLIGLGSERWAVQRYTLLAIAAVAYRITRL